MVTTIGQKRNPEYLRYLTTITNAIRLLLVLSAVLFVNVVVAKTVQEKTGEFLLSHTVAELLGSKAAEKYAPIVAVDELIEWFVYVPSSYQADKPAGLLVYISPTNSGEIPKFWKKVLEERNLIWVSAMHSGNKIPANRRMSFSILATSAIAKQYQLDRERMYVSGFSGGGRVASIVATHYPSLFKGAMYNCGVNAWGDISPENLERVKANRFVFITGKDDFNLNDTKQVFFKYKNAGVVNSKLRIVGGMGHRNPKKREFRKALAYLDGEQ